MKNNFNRLMGYIEVDRKPSNTTDISASTDYLKLPADIQHLINQLPVVESDVFRYEDGKFSFFIDALDGDVQFYLLKHENKTYFIDTQGYHYARYVGEITNYTKLINNTQKSKTMETKLKATNKLMFINFEIPVTVGSVSCNAEYQISVTGRDGDGDLCFDTELIDYVDVKYMDKKVKGYDAFHKIKEFHQTLGIDLDKQLSEQADSKFCSDDLRELIKAELNKGF